MKYCKIFLYGDYIMKAAFDCIVPLLMLRPIPKNRNPINNDK